MYTHATEVYWYTAVLVDTEYLVINKNTYRRIEHTLQINRAHVSWATQLAGTLLTPSRAETVMNREKPSPDVQHGSTADGTAVCLRFQANGTVKQTI